jgi:DNA-binding GntR family transcriptional regulator
LEEVLQAPRNPMAVSNRSLREQVYELLKAQLNRGELEPGSHLDLNALATELGTSRTPLREALLQLAQEGFVTILPRRGVVVNTLGPEEIRHIYEIVGALEGAALLTAAPGITPADLDALRMLSRGMKEALRWDDFASYYEHNLKFHDLFLDRCQNPQLVRTVRLLKERLYDFPRRSGFVKAWEEASVVEHDAVIGLLERGDVRGAADFLRDVHWSYAVQEPFIAQYYFARNGGGGTP